MILTQSNLHLATHLQKEPNCTHRCRFCIKKEGNISSIQHTNLTLYKFVVNSSQMTSSTLIWIVDVDSNVESTKKINPLGYILFQGFYVG